MLKAFRFLFEQRFLEQGNLALAGGNLSTQFSNDLTQSIAVFMRPASVQDKLRGVFRADGPPGLQVGGKARGAACVRCCLSWQ